MARYTLYDRVFSSKGHTEQYIRGILDGAHLETPLRAEVVYRLMSWFSDVHYDWERKRGPGIRAIVVRQNQSNARGFWLLRTDGKETDISYKPYAHTRRARAMDAFRASVSEGLQSFRRRLKWPVTCAVTGRVLEPEEAHVHHHWPLPFCELVERFLSERNLDIEEVKTCSPLGQIGSRLIDKQLEADFIQYHDENAILKVVDADWNIKAGNRPHE